MSEHRTVEENYISASNTSDLRVEADKRNAADVLIAAGWTPGVLGNALMRLQGEWDGSARPVYPSHSRILLAAAKMPREVTVNGETIKRTDKELIALAVKQANEWYSNDLKILRLSLKSIVRVHELIQHWAKDKAQHPEKFAAIITAYWLESICPACSGRGKEVIDGSPVLGEDCKVCNGTGKRKEPMGELGKEALSMMDECVMTARNSMKKRLSNN
jgi:hypothetical protein